MREALPSATILGSRGSRGRGGGGRDADARGGDAAVARRPGLPRRRRSVRGRRALGREAGVVASILGAAAGTVLQARGDANARRQAGGAPPGALRDLGRRGGHPRPGPFSRIVGCLPTIGSSAARLTSSLSAKRIPMSNFLGTFEVDLSRRRRLVLFSRGCVYRMAERDSLISFTRRNGTM